MKRLSKEEHKDKVVGTMGQSPLFQGLSGEQVAKMAEVVPVVRYDPGEVLIREGDPSDSFFIVLNGAASVQVHRKEGEPPAQVARLQQQDIIGEMGVLLDTPRTATVVADGPLVVVEFKSNAFFKLFSQIPTFGLAVCRFLAKRVSQASHRVPLPDYDESEGVPGPEITGLIPVPFVQRHRILPLKSEGSILYLGFVFDPDSHVMDAVRRFAPGAEIRPMRIRSSFLDDVLRSRMGVATTSIPESDGKPAGKTKTKGTVNQPGSGLPFDHLLRRMVAEGASDLHLSAGHRPRWRIDGEMRELTDSHSLGEDEVLELLEPELSPDQLKEFANQEEVDFAYALPGLARFRVNLFRDARGACSVLRVIPEKVLNLAQLGMPPIVEKLSSIAKGLVLVTGPTGSGKSTTLAAMIDSINQKRPEHIVTLEDPIEFVHESAASLVNQREVGSHTRSFSNALRAALREDPDVVLVGEMRDLETISLALETANTGHLVFGTLHTTTAITTVDRIINQFPSEQQAQIRATLSDVLKGVISQVLCQRIEGGRVAALEVLVVNPAVSNLIREGKTHQIATIMSTGKALGNVMMNVSLEELVRERVVIPEDALKLSVDRKDLAARIGK